jgi:tetratricopeptide (TPR) repeat protein
LYYVGLENFKAASGCLDTAVLLGTTKVATYDLNGTLKYRLKDYEGSIKSYSKCIAMDPTHYVVKYMRAEVYMQIQNYKAALEDLEAVLKIEPKNQDYQLALKQCKEKLHI